MSINKSLVIIGPRGSGKSIKAKELAKAVYEENKICIIDGRQRDFSENFYFEDCTKETEIIIVDEVTDVSKLEAFTDKVCGIRIDKRGEHPFDIEPKFIIVCADNITKAHISGTSKYFQRRFNVIDIGETVNL